MEQMPNAIYADTRKKNIFIRKCLLDNKKISITDILKETKLNVHRNTIYYWRHKVMNELIKLQDEIILSGEIHVDETYLPLNYKGNHKSFQMPRESRKRSADLHIRGISKEQVCILTALDDKGLNYLVAIGTGRPTKQKVYDALKNHIKEGSTLISDSTTCYDKLAKALKLNHYKIPSNSHKVEVNGKSFNIQDLNNFHKFFKQYMANYYGVSSKHLNSYLALYSFFRRKDLTDKKKEQTLQKIMTTTDLKPKRKIDLQDRIPKVKRERKKRKAAK